MKVGAGTISPYSAEVLVEGRREGMVTTRSGKTPKLHCNIKHLHHHLQGRGSSGLEESWSGAARGYWGTTYVGWDPLPAGDVLFSARLPQLLEQGWAHVWDLGQCATVGQPKSLQKLHWVEVWARIMVGSWTRGTESTLDQRTSQKCGQTLGVEKTRTLRWTRCWSKAGSEAGTRAKQEETWLQT